MTAAFAVTDVPGPGHPAMVAGATTAALTMPEPGKFCVAGTTVNGWASIALSFITERDGVVQDGLDVQALGAKSLRLTLETPPASGVGVELTSVSPSCHLNDAGCAHYGYYWSTTPTAFAPEQVSDAGAMEAPFADFLRADWIDRSWDLDLTNLGLLQIGYGVPWGTSGDFSYCVKDFAFLDADGTPITP